MNTASDLVPAHLLTPTPEEQLVQEGISGHDPARAHSQCVAANLDKLEYVNKIHPAAAQGYRAVFYRIEADRVGNLAAVGKTHNDLGLLREKLTERGSVRSQILAAKADLETARTTMESPDSLKMEGSVLATMGAKLRHLPNEILVLEKSVGPLSAEIEKLSKSLKLEVPQAVKAFYADACVRLTGTVQDPQFKALCDRGLIL